MAEEIVRCSINHPATYPIVMNNKVKSQFKVPGPTTIFWEVPNKSILLTHIKMSYDQACCHTVEKQLDD